MNTCFNLWNKVFVHGFFESMQYCHAKHCDVMLHQPQSNRNRKLQKAALTLMWECVCKCGGLFFWRSSFFLPAFLVANQPGSV